MKRVRVMKIGFAILFLQLFLSFTSLPGNGQTKNIFINISHFAGNSVLKLDSVNYMNNLGQEFNVTKFKYYIGQITLNQNNGAEFKSDAYFLVNEEDQNSKRLVLENVPGGDYSSIGFVIGVDSLHNCSGAQSGALDPVNAMFWAWNTGYIFLKLEGKSPYSDSPGHLFEYHIGGYKQPNNCIRRINLKLGHLASTVKDQSTINLKVDILELLKNPANIDFRKLPSVTDFHNASLVADNYIDIFSILNSIEKN